MTHFEEKNFGPLLYYVQPNLTGLTKASASSWIFDSVALMYFALGSTYGMLSALLKNVGMNGAGFCGQKIFIAYSLTSFSPILFNEPDIVHTAACIYRIKISVEICSSIDILSQ
jgi:hypothetical protein